MEKETKISLEEFEIFKSEKEKPLLIWAFIGDSFFLIATFIVQFIYQEIFQTGILSWKNYFILVAGNLLLFFGVFFLWRKGHKTWLWKYVFVIFGIILLTTWIYLTDPKYTRTMFTPILLVIALSGGLFYEINLAILATLIGGIAYSFILLHYSHLGSLPPPYEIYLTFLFFILTLLFTFVTVKRTKIYLIELLEKRRELEEAKSVLEVKVEARTKELRELTQGLEGKIKARTKELQERVNQLERFQKLTIGRELKMVELKKEIEKLKEELEKYLRAPGGSL